MSIARSNGKTVIFLGAGASAAEGAPVQGTLFREFFKLYRTRDRRESPHEWDRELATFFTQFFGIDVYRDDLEATAFPTFEEILGILELAYSQGESFRDWQGPHLTNGGTSRLQNVHELLVFSIGDILKEKLSNSHPHHAELVRSLEKAGNLPDTSFASFNYDILIDNAILDLRGSGGIDYGFSFENEPRPDARSSGKPPPVPLFKLHGSLNWLFCPTCRSISLTPFEKGIVLIKQHPRVADCNWCQTPRGPIVIPPTFFKVMSNLFLKIIWDLAEKACSEAKRLVFCGYSLPDADVHVRYLLKRVELRRRQTPDVYVVNFHEQKRCVEAEQEKARYRRFFVEKQKVHYTKLSFKDFASNPQLIEDQSQWL